MLGYGLFCHCNPGISAVNDSRTGCIGKLIEIESEIRAMLCVRPIKGAQPVKTLAVIESAAAAAVCKKKNLADPSAQHICVEAI